MGVSRRLRCAPLDGYCYHAPAATAPDPQLNDASDGLLSTLTTTIRAIREHRRNGRLTRPQLEALKLEKFRRLVRYACMHSPYYRRIVAERGIEIETSGPDDFPILTKSSLMANFDAITTDRRVTKRAIAAFLKQSQSPSERFLGRYRVIHTSGSSGEVGYFVFAPNDWARSLSLLPRGGQSRPVARCRRLRIAYYGASDGHYAGVTVVSALKDNWIVRMFAEVAIYEVNDPLAATIDALNEFQPDFLVGYTTAIKNLAARQRQGGLRLKLSALATSGEVTTDTDKAYLEETFGCPLTNTYACSEHLGMGATSSGGSEMVLYDDELIFEFHDDHTIVTNLFNFTLPLIRYRMADVLRPVADGDRHAPYLTVNSLVGRNELQPVFKNRDGVEDFISPHTINEIFVPGVRRFQLRLVDDTHFRFMICLDPALDPDARAGCRTDTAARLREILDRKMMTNVEFDIVEVDDLPVNPRTRKFQLIVDERPVR
jgi:phenylacetate-coenzyme A ligase PaaK-like adenylate-forming protein